MTDPGDCRVCNTAVHPRCEHCPGGHAPDSCACCGSPYHDEAACDFRADTPHAE